MATGVAVDDFFPIAGPTVAPMTGTDRTSYAVGFADLDSEVSVDSLARHRRLSALAVGHASAHRPRQVRPRPQTVNHWFDGLAMLHRFGFEDGRVSYRNRFLRSRDLLRVEEKGALAHGGFATDPCRTLFQRVAAIFHPTFTDNGNVSIDVFGGEPVALTETTLPVCFDPETLAALGDRAYGPQVGGQISIAHPHHDTERALPLQLRRRTSGARATTACSPSPTTVRLSASSPRCRSTGPPTCTPSP